MQVHTIPQPKSVFHLPGDPPEHRASSSLCPDLNFSLGVFLPQGPSRGHFTALTPSRRPRCDDSSSGNAPSHQSPRFVLGRPLLLFIMKQAAFKAFSRPHPRISPWSPHLPYPDALPCREPESADFRPAAMLTPPLIPEKSPTGSVLYLHLTAPSRALPP